MSTSGALEADAARRRIGRFAVTVDPAQAEAFRAALALDGQPASPGVPLTYPLAWWMEPAIKTAIVRAMDMDPFSRDAALVHLDQTLDYHRPLRAGENCTLDLLLVGPDSHGRFRVEARVVDSAGDEVALMTGGFFRTRLDAR